MMNPRFPIYIPTKGRADSRLTIRALQSMGVPFYAIIEEQEFDEYAAAVDPTRLLILDKRYQDDYETCDDLGTKKSKGPGPARNFAWDHSIKSGFDWHWVMDDNIRDFLRTNRNRQIRVDDGTIFRCMEDFCLRYKNVSMAGPNYLMFAKRKQLIPPFIKNTRIYSCNLIRNDAPYRWRGRYNEDTDLSLRMLKDGWCTIQFNAFLQNKTVTQAIGGGNTKEFYALEGTRPKSKMIVKLHPDVATEVWKFGRYHHHVDYRPFKKTKLIRDESISVDKGIDNYGMRLKRRKKTKPA